MTICNCDEFNTDVTFSGNIKLGGAIAKINDRANVGITSNSFDDLIHNFDGAPTGSAEPRAAVRKGR